MTPVVRKCCNKSDNNYTVISKSHKKVTVEYVKFGQRLIANLIEIE